MGGRGGKSGKTNRGRKVDLSMFEGLSTEEENALRKEAKKLADDIAERDGITYTEAMRKALEQLSNRKSVEVRMTEIKQLKKRITSLKAQETKANHDYMAKSGAVIAFDYNSRPPQETEKALNKARKARDDAYNKWQKIRIERGKAEIDLDRKVREYRGVGRATPRDSRRYTDEDIPF